MSTDETIQMLQTLKAIEEHLKSVAASLVEIASAAKRRA
jgi:hypothetical protein